MSKITNKPDALWYTRCSVPTPLSLAVLKGWIDDEFAGDGIAIKSLRDSVDPAEQASHFDHTLPHSFRQGGSVPAIWAKSGGRDTKVIAISWTDEFQAIIAAPGAKISSIKELKGRRIGIPRHAIRIDHNRASAFRAFKLLLAAEGLSLNDVEVVDLPDLDEGDGAGVPSLGRRRGHSYRNEALALARGQVDAVYVKDVRGWEVINLVGANIIADIGFHPDPFIRISNCAPRPLTVNADTLALYPDLVERFLARVVDAGEWAAQNPDETVRLIAQETGWAERAVRQSFGDRAHLALTAELSDAFVDGLGQFVDFLATDGFIPNNFNVRDWVDPAPLAAVTAGRARKAA